MKKVLITGASGFLGSHLTRELYRAGYETRILVRREASLGMLSDIPCEIFYGNIENPGNVQAAVAGCDVVIHAAAITRQWNIPFEQYERINFTATRYVAEAVMQQGVAKLIFVSTANTIGPGSREAPGTELNGFTLFTAGSGYITSKYLAQQYVLEQVEKNRLPALVVNPSFMIGPCDVKPGAGRLLLYAAQNRVLLCPPGGKNFVHVLDVCRGIINAIERGKIGDCYLLGGENMSYREFFRLVNRAAHRSPVMIQIPTFIWKLCGMLGSLQQWVLRKEGMLNRSTAYMMCRRTYYSAKKSERELGITYTPVAQAVHEALNWFKEHNYY